MSNQKSNLTLIIIVVFFILFLGAWSRRQKSNGPGFDLPEYALQGSYEVGMRAYEIETGNGLAITAWYPARPVETGSARTRYAYAVKMGPPLGAVTIASFGGRAATDAAFDPEGGPYPLVILSPGFSIGSTAYAWLAEHLASHGFVVISPDHAEHLDPGDQLWRSAITRPQDVLAVLSFLDDQSAPGGIFEGLVEMERIAVMGHSYGGYTALAAAGARIDTAALRAHCQAAVADAHEAAWICDMLLPQLPGMAGLAGLEQVPAGAWPAAADPRIAAVISLAGDAFLFGEAGLAEIRVPLLAIGGTEDQDSPFAWSARPAYEHSSGPRKIEIALEGAEHMIFTAPCEHARWYLKFISGEFCSDRTWDRAYAHAVSRHFVTAFLLAELQGSAAAAAALAPGAVSFDDVGYRAEGFGD